MKENETIIIKSEPINIKNISENSENINKDNNNIQVNNKDINKDIINTKSDNNVTNNTNTIDTIDTLDSDILAKINSSLNSELDIRAFNKTVDVGETFTVPPLDNDNDILNQKSPEIDINENKKYNDGDLDKDLETIVDYKIRHTYKRIRRDMRNDELTEHV